MQNPQPILSRVFDYTGGKLELVVFPPSQTPTNEWACDFALILDGIQVAGHPVFGEDSVQALLLALGLASTEIELLLERSGGRISDFLLADLRRLE